VSKMLHHHHHHPHICSNGYYFEVSY
jgi:hypothetical protein